MIDPTHVENLNKRLAVAAGIREEAFQYSEEYLEGLLGRLAKLPKHEPTEYDPDACQHKVHFPEFDSEAAQGLDAEEVQRRWPRFFGECALCGQRMILYASAEHYILGDW